MGNPSFKFFYGRNLILKSMIDFHSFYNFRYV